MSETILRGCTAAKTNPELLKRTCRKLKLPVERTDRDAMIVELSDYFVKLHKADPGEILTCNDCGGGSDSSYDACPYCGVKDEEQAGGAPVPKAAAEPASEPKVFKKSGAKVLKKAPAKVFAAVPPPSEHFPGSAHAGPDDVHQGEVLTAQDLDRSVACMLDLTRSAVTNMRQLADELQRCHDMRLYSLRLSAGGSPKYKQWGEFTKAELGISGGHAMKIMTVAQLFSDADIAKIGVTKLYLLTSIADSKARETNLERAKKQNLTREEIASEVRTERAASGSRDTERRGNKPKEPKRLALSVEPGNPARTLVFQGGRHVEPAYQTAHPIERAHTLEDLPVSRFTAAVLNDLTIIVRTVLDAGGLSHVLEFVRGEA